MSTFSGMISIMDADENEVLMKVMVVRSGVYMEDLAKEIVLEKDSNPDSILKRALQKFGEDTKLTILYRTEEVVAGEEEFDVLSIDDHAELDDFTEEDYEDFNDPRDCPMLSEKGKLGHFFTIAVEGEDEIFILRDREGEMVLSSNECEDEEDDDDEEDEGYLSSLLTKIEKLEGIIKDKDEDIELLQAENRGLRRLNKELREERDSLKK